MILNAQGKPSGEAFIQLDGEQAATNLANHKNGKSLYAGARRFIVEVIQCSGEDMNLVLMGILSSNLTSTSAHGHFPYTQHVMHHNTNIPMTKNEQIPTSNL